MAGAAFLGGGFGGGGGIPSIQKYARPGVGGGNIMTQTSGPGMPGGSFRKGLPRVPFNEFPAILHEDEAVLPAAEANQYRELKAEGAIPQPPSYRQIQAENPQPAGFQAQGSLSQALVPPAGVIAPESRIIGSEPSIQPNPDLAPGPPPSGGMRLLGQSPVSRMAPSQSPGFAFLGGNDSGRLPSGPPAAVRPQSSLSMIRPELDLKAPQDGQQRIGYEDAAPSLSAALTAPVQKPMMGLNLPMIKAEPSGYQAQTSTIPTPQNGMGLIAPQSGFDAGMRLGSPSLTGNASHITAEAPGGDLPFDQWHNESLASGNPVKAEQALRDILGPAYDDVAPGKRQQLLAQVLNEDTSPHKKGMGFKERVVHGLKALGLTTLMTGNPFLGVVGGVWSAADPNAYHRFKHNMIDVPHAQNEAAIENQQQQQNLNRSAQYAGYSGVNRYTGKPTAQMQTHMDAQQASAQQRREQNAKAAVDAARRYKTPVDSKTVAGTTFETFAGKVPPVDMGDAHSAVNAYGQFGQPVPKDLVAGTPYEPLGGQTSGAFVRQQANGILSAYTKGAKLTPESKQLLSQAGYPADLPDVYDPKTVNLVPNNATCAYDVVRVGRNSGSISTGHTGIQAPPRASAKITASQAHVEAEKQMRSEGKIDGSGTMENPKWRQEFDYYKGLTGSDKAAEAAVGSSVPRRIPFAEHPDFKNRKTQVQAGGGSPSKQASSTQGKSAPQPHQLSKADVQPYADANHWDYNKAAEYLRSTGQYIVP